MFMRPKRVTNPWPATKEAMADSPLQCTEGREDLICVKFTDHFSLPAFETLTI